jgi:type VI secretion system protein ImpJ
MTLERRVMWKEGMFLRPHHFQQQDRRFESALAARIAAIQPFHWGFTALEIDESRLESGTIALRRASGAFRDGAVFVLGEDTTEATPAMPSRGDGAIVRLIAPMIAEGAAIGANDVEGRVNAARYAIRPHALRDALQDGAATEPVELGALNLSLHVGDAPAGYDDLPVARIAEVAQGRVRLDPTFIPPILHVRASPWLANAVATLAERFRARASQLAGSGGVAGALSPGANRSLMLLSVCNAKAALLSHVERSGALTHPETLYRMLIEAAAELLTMTDKQTRRPPDAETYDHDDLASCFAPLIDAINMGLGRLDDPEAREIPLSINKQYKIHYNESVDATLLDGARIYLVASASVPDETLRTKLPRNVSIASTAEIFDYITAATQGATMRAMPHFPQELRPRAGAICFEIDRNNDAWKGVRSNQSVAIHAQEGFTDLELQLWTVRD